MEIKKIALIGVGSSGWIGGIYYIMNILNALDKTETPLEVHLFRTSEQIFPDHSQFKNIRLYEREYTDLFAPYTLSNKIVCRLKKIFLGHINPRIERFLIDNKFDYVFPERLTSHNGKVNVGSWIADFQYKNFPQGASKDIIAYAEKTISDIANNAPKIILSSKVCEDECINYFPKSKGRTFSMPFAVYLNREFIQDNLDKVRSKYNLPSHFFVVSNLFAPTKNHKTLFEAIGILKKEGLPVQLFCTGNLVDTRNLNFPNQILEMLTNYNIRDCVHILGMIPRDEQIAIYRMADALVQPSLHEGWNTTIEEGKALGKTIIASNIDVHQEQLPNCNNLFNPLDAQELAKILSRVSNECKNDVFPNLENELNSLQSYDIEVKAFGNRFLQIAKS